MGGTRRVETTHERKGRVITNLVGKSKKTYPSINEAKRESAIIQRSNGGLGAGSVDVRD